MKIEIISYNVDEKFNQKELEKLPKEIEIPDNENVEDFVLDSVGVPLYEYKVIK